MITFTGKINGQPVTVEYDEENKTVEAHPSIMSRINEWNEKDPRILSYPYARVNKPGDTLANANNLEAVLTFRLFDAGSLRRSDRPLNRLQSRELPDIGVY